MTLGEFKQWCEENGVDDDALLTVYDAEEFQTMHVEEEALEVVSDADEDQNFVQIGLAQIRKD